MAGIRDYEGERETDFFSWGQDQCDGCGAQHDIARWSNLRISCIVCAAFALKDVLTRLNIFNVWDGFYATKCWIKDIKGAALNLFMTVGVILSH